MDGAVAVVTGANTGLGKETALALASAGARTILACRHPGKGQEAADEIRRVSNNDEVVTVRLELRDLESVRRCAQEILDRWTRVDVLVNNAGGTWSNREVTAHGFEQTFLVNYLSHYALTRWLSDGLRRRPASRIVNVSSHGHRFVRRIHWNDLQFEKRWWAPGAYGQSKLAQILFTQELARRYGREGVIAHACHPGVVRTHFGVDGDTHGLDRVVLKAVMLLSVAPPRGAETSIYLAMSPDVGESNGGYWAHCRPSRPSRAATDADAAQRLWDVSEQLVIDAGFAFP